MYLVDVHAGEGFTWSRPYFRLLNHFQFRFEQDNLFFKFLMAEPRLSFNRFQLVDDSISVAVNHIPCVPNGCRTWMTVFGAWLSITMTALGMNVTGIVTNRILFSTVPGVDEMSSVELFVRSVTPTRNTGTVSV